MKKAVKTRKISKEKRVERVKKVMPAVLPADEQAIQPAEQLPSVPAAPEQPIGLKSTVDVTFASFRRSKAGTRWTSRADLSWADKVCMFGTAGRYPIRSIAPASGAARIK